MMKKLRRALALLVAAMLLFTSVGFTEEPVEVAAEEIASIEEAAYPEEVGDESEDAPVQETEDAPEDVPAQEFVDVTEQEIGEMSQDTPLPGTEGAPEEIIEPETESAPDVMVEIDSTEETNGETILQPGAPKVTVAPEWELDAETGAITIPYIEIPETLNFEWTFDGEVSGYAVQVASDSERGERIFSEEAHICLPAESYIGGDWFTLYIAAILPDGTEYEAGTRFRLEQKTGEIPQEESEELVQEAPDTLFADERSINAEPHEISTNECEEWGHSWGYDENGQLDGICDECGARCPHDGGSYSYKDYVQKAGTKPFVLDAQNHVLKIDYVRTTKCDICGSELSRKVLKTGLMRNEMHEYYDYAQFTDSDVCFVCHYDRSNCQHKNVETTYIPISEDCSFERIDGNNHYVNGWVETWTTCQDCGKTLTEEEQVEVHNLIQPCYYTKKGKCTECGAKKGVCNHPQKGYMINEGGTEYYKNVNKSGYHILHREDFTEYCYRCPYEKHFKSKETQEPHKYLPGSNVCVFCGYDGHIKSTSIKLNQSKLTVKRYSTTTLKATLSPKNTYNKALNWTSSDETIATVEDGVVKALNNGTVTITCIAQDGGCGVANCTITVVPIPPKSIKITAPEKADLIVGEKLQLHYELSPEKAETTVKWRVSPTSVAVIDKKTGLLRAVGMGTARVTASTSNKKESKSLKITVTDPYLPTSVVLDKKGEVELNLGETLKLNASLVPDTAQSDIDWLTSRKEIATVKDGVVTPLREGTTKITARTRKKTPKGNFMTASVNVTVVDPTRPTGITIDQVGPLTIYTGETRQLTCSLSPKIAVSDIEWTSSKSTIAKVTANGVIQPKKNGTVTITAEAKRADKKKGAVKAKIKVTVKKQKKPAQVYLSKSDIPFGVYDKGSLLKVGGIAISNYDIAELHIDIYKGNTKEIVRTFTAEPWACEYDISAANAALDLMSLGDGSYRIKVTALSNGETWSLCDTEFQYGDRADELTAERREKLKKFVANPENRDIFTFAYADYIVKSKTKLDSSVRIVDDIFNNLSLFNLIEAGFIYKGQSKDLIELYEKEIITLVDSGAFDGVSFLDDLEDKTQYQFEFLKQGGKLAELLPDGNWKVFVTSADKLLKAVHSGIKEQTKWETTCQRIASITANMENGMMILDYIGESANYASKDEFRTALKNVKTEYAHACAVHFDEIAKRIYSLAAKKIEKEFDELMDDLWEFAGSEMTLTNGLSSLTGRTLMHIYGLDELSSAWKDFYTQLDLLYVTVDAYQTAFDKVAAGNNSDELLKKLFITGGLAKRAWHRLHETILDMELHYYVITEAPNEHEVFGTHPEWGSQAIGNHALSEWNSPKFQELPFYNPDEEET